jgi:hypothetical protein
VLSELPKQVCAFYNMKGIKPQDFKKPKKYSEMNEMERMIKDSQNPKILRSIQEMEDEKTSRQVSKKGSPKSVATK